MFKILVLGTCARAVNLLNSFIMPKNNEKFYYAVGRGREIGIFESWKECKAQTDGITNPKFRKFSSIEEAEEFVSFWKNYSSPSKIPIDSEKPVSNHVKGGRKKSLKITSKSFAFSPGLLPKTGGVVLGRKQEVNRNRDLENTFHMASYVSPISSIPDSNNYFNSPWFRNRKCERKNGKAAKGRGGVECGEEGRKNGSELRFSVDGISTPETGFHFSVTGSPVTPNLVPSSVFPKSDSGCAGVDLVKKEIVEIENESEDCRGSKELLDVGDMLATCLTTLESAVKIISKQNDKESVRVRNGLRALALEILSDINDGVNPQMDCGDENADKYQGSGNDDSGPSIDVPAVESSQPPQHRQHHQSPCAYSESPSVLPSQSFDGRVDQKNVDVLALNLRLDSFEKRFDACLKEVGAIVSEMSHIKFEIKELKESMSSGSRCSPSKTGPGCWPGKTGGGLTQTTLNFGTKTSGSSESTCPSSFRCYSSDKDDANPGELETDRRRGLKRKLSASDNWGNPKRASDVNDGGGTVEILNRIKMETVDYTSFTLDSDEYVEVYTDGACHSNGKHDARAGIGIWFGNSHPLNVAEPVDGPPTNNSAEIQAARVAIELALKAGVSKLKIHTDSEFLINCATKWMQRWKKNGWTLVNGGQVKNRKELEKLDKVASKIRIRWEKVEAHSGIHGNEMADRLANEGAVKYKR